MLTPAACPLARADADDGGVGDGDGLAALSASSLSAEVIGA